MQRLMQRLLRHVPNVLTVARAATIPVIWWLYSRDVPDASWYAAWLILFAAVSDIADGLIARSFDVQSEFGLWVDPTVDRVFFFSLMAMLWWYDTLPLLAVLPILIRDGIILLLALPTRRYTSGKPQPSGWGKASNFIVICALQWFVVDLRFLGWAFYLIGVSLYVASGLLYGYQAVVFVAHQRQQALRG